MLCKQDPFSRPSRRQLSPSFIHYVITKFTVQIKEYCTHIMMCCLREKLQLNSEQRQSVQISHHIHHHPPVSVINHENPFIFTHSYQCLEINNSTPQKKHYRYMNMYHQTIHSHYAASNPYATPDEYGNTPPHSISVS